MTSRSQPLPLHSELLAGRAARPRAWAPRPSYPRGVVITVASLTIGGLGACEQSSAGDVPPVITTGGTERGSGGTTGGSINLALGGTTAGGVSAGGATTGGAAVMAGTVTAGEGGATPGR
jgi:hypothetical protein